MMAARNDHRSYVRGLLLAAALAGFSLSSQAISRGTDQARGQAVWDAAVNGKTTTVGGGNGSMTVTAPYKPSTVDANGNVALQTGPGNVNVNGQSVPVSVNGTIGKGDIANAALSAASCAAGGGGAVGAVVCGGVALAIPIALNWLANAGVRAKPGGGFEYQPKPQVSDGFEYSYPGVANYSPDRNVQCAAGVAVEQAATPGYTVTLLGVTMTSPGEYACNMQYKLIASGDVSSAERSLYKRPATNCPAGYFIQPGGQCTATNDAKWQDITALGATGLMNNSRIPSADIVKELDAAGQSAAMQPQAGTVRVTGPAAVTGPSSTSVTNNSTTNTTTNTTTTTNNYTYNTNTVTNTTNTSVTTTSTGVKNPDGTTTTTAGPTTTTTTNTNNAVPAKPEEQPTQCDKFPDTLGCAQLDTPTAEIPRETKNVTFEAEDVLGGGQCPADVMATLSTLDGRSVKIIDWTTFCGFALPLRALVMGLAAIMAFFIIMPGGVRE